MIKSFLRDDEQLIDQLSKFCPTPEGEDKVKCSVTEILKDIRENGDTGVLSRTLLYDKAKLESNEIRVTQKELEKAKDDLLPQERESILEAIENVTLFHEQRVPKNWDMTNNHGAKVGEKYYPIDRVGIYVPGGNVPLISTVIMTVTIAKVAKVKQIVVVTPPSPEGKIAPQMLAALSILGVEEIYKVGGAQAIAALAYGTKTITPVDKIFGPGNAFVNEAKRQVYGTVGIDLLPGPSELMVIADSSSTPAFVAAALLSQAEHGSGKEKIFLLFSEENHFEKIINEIKIQLPSLTHRKAIEKVLSNGFVSVYIPTLERIATIANFIAPEHLELQVNEDNIEFLTSEITTAGAFLLGHSTSTSLGDFVAGPSHVLPTGRSSRFSSGLRLNDFFRRSSFIQYNKESAIRAKKSLEVFAEMEQLDGHGKSFSIRI